MKLKVLRIDYQTIDLDLPIESQAVSDNQYTVTVPGGKHIFNDGIYLGWIPDGQQPSDA